MAHGARLMCRKSPGPPPLTIDERDRFFPESCPATRRSSAGPTPAAEARLSPDGPRSGRRHESRSAHNKPAFVPCRRGDNGRKWRRTALMGRSPTRPRAQSPGTGQKQVCCEQIVICVAAPSVAHLGSAVLPLLELRTCPRSSGGRATFWKESISFVDCQRWRTG